MQPKKYMLFIDGSNFLIELSKEINIPFRADKPPWSILDLAKLFIGDVLYLRNIDLIRKYWFTSYQGNEEYKEEYRVNLRRHGFEPVLFQKRNQKEKGVDIALTKEMLVNAFHQNFEHGILFAGDEDYVGLVEEVKRYGQLIEGAFFAHGLSPLLRVAFDTFYEMKSENLEKPISTHIESIKKEISNSKKD